MTLNNSSKLVSHEVKTLDLNICFPKYRCLYIDSDDCGGGLVLADTGEVKDNMDRKHFDIEMMMNGFLAVATMKTVFMCLAIIMCMVVI